MQTTAATLTGPASIADKTIGFLMACVRSDQQIARRSPMSEEILEAIGNSAEQAVRTLEASDCPITKDEVINRLCRVLSAYHVPGETPLSMIRDIAVSAARETAEGETGERWRGIERVLTEW